MKIGGFSDCKLYIALPKAHILQQMHKNRVISYALNTCCSSTTRYSLSNKIGFILMGLWSFIISLLIPLLVTGQPAGFEINYPGPHAEGALAITNTSDGGYVMTGFQGIGVGYGNIALRKVNADGDEQWVQYIGEGGSNDGFAIIENNWGNLVIAGNTNESTPPQNHFEAYIAELDENGELIWSKTYSASTGSGVFSDVQITSDLGYVAAGGQANLIGENSQTDVFVVRTDAVGDTLWTFQWGTSFNDIIRELYVLGDGSILCAGTTYDAFGFQDMLLIKLNSSGELQWLQTYDFEGHDFANSIAVDSQNNILLGGATAYTGSDPYELYDICVVKTDSLGNLIWHKTYGGNKSDGVEQVLLDEDDNIYAIGLSSSYKPPGSPGGYAGYLKKLNTEGDSIWTRVFYEGASVHFYDLQPTADNGFMICGSTNARMYLVRTDEWGCIEEGCEIQTGFDESISANEVQLTLWSNPTKGRFQISVHQPIKEEHRIEVFNVNGRNVYSSVNSLKFSQTQAFDISNWSDGIYIIRLTINDGYQQNLRILKSE